MKKLLSLAAVAILGLSLMACSRNSAELTVTSVRQGREGTEFNDALVSGTLTKGKIVTGDKVTIERDGSKQDTYTVEEIVDSNEKTITSVSSDDKLDKFYLILSDKGSSTASDYNDLNVKENDKIVK